MAHVDTATMANAGTDIIAGHSGDHRSHGSAQATAAQVRSAAQIPSNNGAFGQREHAGRRHEASEREQRTGLVRGGVATSAP
jgi:hypothetical protein